MAVMARLNSRCNTISFARKFKYYKSLCHLHPPLCLKQGSCWLTLKKEEEKNQAFETKCLRKLLRISCLEHKTNDWVRS